MSLRDLFQKKEPAPGLCCLYITQDKFVFSYAVLNAEKRPVFHFVETHPFEQSTFQTTLLSLVKKHGVEQARCNWVLNPNHYQLLLLDAPKVEPQEIKEALRWQIKDLINFQPEDAAIDFLKIPSPYREKLFVIVSPIPMLKSIADQINDAELQLTTIDIPELAFRNMTALLNEPNCYLGFLVVQQGTAELIITYQNDLLLAQNIVLPPDFTLEQPSQAFITEIQNGFTYCTSQQQIDMPKKLYIANSTGQIATILQEQLIIEVVAFQLDNNLSFDCVINNDFQTRPCLSAIGGACREYLDYATN